MPILTLDKPAAVPAAPPLFRLRSFGKQYREAGDRRTVVFDDLTFDVPDVPMLALIGNSGAGKSTLAAVLSGADTDYAGTVEFDGHPIPRAEGEPLRRHRLTVTQVWQQFNLVSSLPLALNAGLSTLIDGGTVRQARADGLAALAVVGLADQAHKLPSQVSGGQRQRTAIARAYAGTARVIIADEPTGNLDPRNRDAVMRAFAAVAGRGKRVLFITHAHDLAAQCDRVLGVEHGLVDVTADVRQTRAAAAVA